jgi:hypothetical protein
MHRQCGLSGTKIISQNLTVSTGIGEIDCRVQYFSRGEFIGYAEESVKSTGVTECQHTEVHGPNSGSCCNIQDTLGRIAYGCEE